MELIRYILVQLVAYVIDFGFFSFINYLTNSILIANIVAKILAGTFAFYGHRIFTFRLKGSSGAEFQAAKYFIALGINIPIASLILLGYINLISNLSIAKFASDISSVLLSFWVGRRFVFVAKG